MLKKVILDKMNRQINLEHFSSNLYLSMSSWCKAQGLDGAAKFLAQHSSEELGHMQKLFKYVNETGSQAIISGIEAPDTQFKNIKDVFEQTYKHELLITTTINELVELTLQEKDYATFNFLQWYVSEQHEEEALFKGIIDKMNIIGLEGRGLFMIDKEIGNLVAN
ncbi:MAG: non-heme ferritin [Arcobacteraceae bacterium]|jgi:ferritin|nr:non-heme ferritin [Arcobacteraceae bacterium]